MIYTCVSGPSRKVNQCKFRNFNKSVRKKCFYNVLGGRLYRPLPDVISPCFCLGWHLLARNFVLFYNRTKTTTVLERGASPKPQVVKILNHRHSSFKISEVKFVKVLKVLSCLCLCAAILRWNVAPKLTSVNNLTSVKSQ